MFIFVELAERYPETVPAGFRGYDIKGDENATSGKAPDIYYKTTYLSGETIYKTYV